MSEKFNPAAPVVVDPPAVVRADTTRAEQVIDEVVNLDRSMEVNQFVLGDLFAEIVEGQYWAADHCESLKEFLVKRGIRLSPREVQYRTNVSKKSKRLGITREQQLKAGISKMKLICELNPDLEHVDPETGKKESMADIMTQLIVAAPATPLPELKKQMTEFKVRTEGEDSVLKWLNLPVFESRLVFMEDVIDKFVKASGDTIEADEEESELTPAERKERKQARDVSRATAVERIFAEALSGLDPEESNAYKPGNFEDEVFDEDNEGNRYELAY